MTDQDGVKKKHGEPIVLYRNDGTAEIWLPDGSIKIVPDSEVEVNKTVQIMRMMLYTQRALTQLESTDTIACELGNKNLIDFHVNSTMAKLSYNALERVRELIKYLETIVEVKNE